MEYGARQKGCTKTRFAAQISLPQRFALDSAGVIFPSTVSRVERHLYCFTVAMNEDVDGACLQAALDETVKRFPTIAARLQTGLCWYWLKPLAQAPRVAHGIGELMPPMTHRDLRKCCLRICYQDRRIRIDFFHALADGYGATIFLKTLLAAYVRLRYHTAVPYTHGVLDTSATPSTDELEDCYPRFAAKQATPYVAGNAYKELAAPSSELRGTILTMPAQEVLSRARALHVSVTEYMAAMLLIAIYKTKQQDPLAKPEQPVQLAIPVNLRKLFRCTTLRNFALCCTVTLGNDLDFEAVCESVKSQMAQQNTAPVMAGIMKNNLRLIRIARFALWPLFLKNIAMKIGYRLWGNDTAFMSLSNLGSIELPDALFEHVHAFSCMMDANAHSTHSLAVLSYNQSLHLNFCRSIEKTTLEDCFSGILSELGISFKRTEI